MKIDGAHADHAAYALGDYLGAVARQGVHAQGDVQPIFPAPGLYLGRHVALERELVQQSAEDVGINFSADQVAHVGGRFGGDRAVLLIQGEFDEMESGKRHDGWPMQEK